MRPDASYGMLDYSENSPVVAKHAPVSLWGKVVGELIGTFFLVLTLCMLSVQHGVLVPLAVGFALTALIFVFGPLSGAQFNPAVSLSLVARGRMPLSELVPYCVAQLAGSGLASVVTRVLARQGVSDLPLADRDTWPALLGEFLFSFLLCWTVMSITSPRNPKAGALDGLVVGCVVAAGAFAVGAISGAYFNPAVVLGTTLLGAEKVGYALLVVGASAAGGVAAAALARVMDV